MSAVSEAAANTVLRIANLFEQNCALKHGLPKVGGPDRIDKMESPQPPPVAPPAVNITNNIPAPPPAMESPSPSGSGVAGQSSLWRRAAPFLITAAAGAAGAGVPLGVWSYLRSDSQPTLQQDGDLLQELQRRGHHLPEGTPWQTK